MKKHGIFVPMEPKLEKRLRELAEEETRSAPRQCTFLIAQVLQHLELCKKIGIIDKDTELPQPEREKRKMPGTWELVMGGSLQ